VMDWKALIPPPIPDDENFYKAPKMSEWMTGRGSKFGDLLPPWPQPRANNTLIALIQVVPPGAAHPGAKDAVVSFDDPNAATKWAKFLETVVGPTTIGVRDYTYVARLPDPSAPPVLFLETAATLDGNAVEGLFGKKAIYPAKAKRVSFIPFGIE